MLDKYTSEASNYNSRKTSSKKRAMVYFVTAIVSSVALFIAGCSAYQQGGDEPNKETPYAPKITSSPTPSATPAPTAEPTATPELTPSVATPTSTSIPLKLEEKIKKFGNVHENDAVPLNQLVFADYLIDGVNKMSFFYFYGLKNEIDGDVIVYFTNLPDDTLTFSIDGDSFETYGYGKEGFPYYKITAEGYQGKDLEMLYVWTVSDFEKTLASKGIEVPKTKFSEKINNSDGSGYMKASDIVEYLATVLPDSYCVFHEDLIGNNAEATPAPTK